MASDKPVIAIATGDPAGIGPEISLKAALDPAVQAACHPILVSDPDVLNGHAAACGIATKLHVVTSASKAVWSDDHVNVVGIASKADEIIPLGTTSAAAGSAGVACARIAIWMAHSHEVDAVVAAPQNETSIAMAGIPFDGHPSFVARETATNPERVFMMLCFDNTKIAHATLHQSVRSAIDAITADRVVAVIEATDTALKRLGTPRPKIAVSGLNPHAGEGGLFGREEIEVIKPAIDAAAVAGIDVVGPFGADTMFHLPGIDAFVVMLHDQGHVAAKIMAPNAAAALTIGTPILFSSVAHGSAHDIAGKGIADASAMIDAVLRMAQARR